MSRYFEKLMPALFCGNLILLGMSAGQHDLTNVFLFGLGVLGTLPTLHKQAWERIICPQSGNGSGSVGDQRGFISLSG